MFALLVGSDDLPDLRLATAAAHMALLHIRR
jgi:hypothetical protein